MVDESQYPLEFELFKEAFIQLRVNNDIANGGDGVQVRADVTAAFASGWRPPHAFDVWVLGRSNLKVAKAIEVTTSDGTFWQPVVLIHGDFRITKEEAEALAVARGYRLE